MTHLPSKLGASSWGRGMWWWEKRRRRESSSELEQQRAFCWREMAPVEMVRVRFLLGCVRMRTLFFEGAKGGR